MSGDFGSLFSFHPNPVNDFEDEEICVSKSRFPVLDLRVPLLDLSCELRSAGSTGGTPAFFSLADPKFRLAGPEGESDSGEKKQAEVSAVIRPAARQHCGELIAALVHFFAELSIERVLELRDWQFELAVCIVHRKFGSRYDFASQPADCREALKLFFNQNRHKSMKRREENNKFVFKHLMSLVRQRLRSARLPAESVSRQGADELIARKYFSAEAGTTDSKRTRKCQHPLKSDVLSLARLREIFKNRELRSDCLEVLLAPAEGQSPLLADYLRCVPSKLRKIFKKWDKKLAERGCADAALRGQIQRYFIENNQCKLPWTVFEVQNAINCFQASIL